MWAPEMRSSLTLEHEHITEVFTSFGAPGRSAESVAEQAAEEVRAYLAHSCPVGHRISPINFFCSPWCWEERQRVFDLRADTSLSVQPRSDRGVYRQALQGRIRRIQTYTVKAAD